LEFPFPKQQAPMMNSNGRPLPISGLHCRGWARVSILDRLPQILEQLLSQPDIDNSPNTVQTSFVRNLINCIKNNNPLPKIETGPVFTEWNEISKNQSWLSGNWFFVEALFYRVILEHVNYFVSSSPNDPFRFSKEKALSDAVGTIEEMAIISNKIFNTSAKLTRDALDTFLQMNLWSNKSDLSKNPQGCSTEKLFQELELNKANIIINDLDAIWEFIQSMKSDHSTPSTLGIICDNSGLEIVSDLFLGELFLRYNVCNRVVFHLKFHPTFVSDSTLHDLEYTLHFLQSHTNHHLRELASRWKKLMDQHVFLFESSAYWNHYSPFWDLPLTLFEALQSTTLVIVKGDANTRRLHGDLDWSFTTPTSEIINYFPTHLMIIRTLKSETVSGVKQEQIDEFERKGEKNWYHDGKYGMIQLIQSKKTENLC